jgi:inositol-hexakisphosphate kinase
MVLEDLTRNFKHPCICDVKMGTRQHGDDAPADKRFRHQNKVLTTTSLPLGVRMCGIQVYQVKTNSYKYTSKYDGRKLKKDTIKPAIADFYNNGIQFRLDVLVQFVEKLKEFYEVMQSLDDKFRFYSTSLLMVYEGDLDAPPRIDIKMIDFAHTFMMAENDINDDGYLFGLRNFIDLMVQIVDDHKDQGNSKL